MAARGTAGIAPGVVASDRLANSVATRCAWGDAHHSELSDPWRILRLAALEPADRTGQYLLDANYMRGGRRASLPGVRRVMVVGLGRRAAARLLYFVAVPGATRSYDSSADGRSRSHCGSKQTSPRSDAIRAHSAETSLAMLGRIAK